MEGGDFGGGEKMVAKIEVGNQVIDAGFKNICDENEHNEAGKGMLMLSTNEINSSLTAKITEGKSVNNSSDEILSQSDLSEGGTETKRVPKRKRNQYCKRKWLVTPIMSGKERQPIVAKRKLAKVKECMTEKCEKPEASHEKGDMMPNPVLENEIGRKEKVEKKFWPRELFLRAFGLQKNDNISVGIPGCTHDSKPLVHNSGIIRVKLERLSKLRILGEEKKEKSLMTETVGKMPSPNSDLTAAPVSSGPEITDLKHGEFILLGDGKVDLKSDSIGTSHYPPEIKPKPNVSFDLLRSYLSAYIGKASVNPPNIVVGGKMKDKETDQPLPISQQRILSGRTGQPNLVPYTPHFPSWVSLEAEAEFLQESSVRKLTDLNKCLPGSNCSAVSMPKHAVPWEGKLVDDPGSSLLSTRTALDKKILDVGPLNLSECGNLDSDSFTKSGFSYVDSDLDDKKSLKKNETRLSSIRKRFQGWDRAIRRRLTGQGPKEKSVVNDDPESVEREEPKDPNVKYPSKMKKKIFGKNKSSRQVVPLTLTFFAVPRINVVNNCEEWMEVRDQAIPGDDSKTEEQKYKH